MVTDKMIEAAAREIAKAMEVHFGHAEGDCISDTDVCDDTGCACKDLLTSAARAALEAAEAAAWEPMEAAPRDEPIWFYAPAAHGLPSLQGSVKHHDDAGYCVDELRTPTHWRPLPAPPETSDE